MITAPFDCFRCGKAACVACTIASRRPSGDQARPSPSIVIAALFVPLRRRVQGFIDRRFYRRKYDATRILSAFGSRAREDVNQAVHGWGGVVLHDVINNVFAHKAIEKGADGLIAVAAGAGGHAGVKSPFALVQEIRQWFDGPLALSGSISTGDAVLAAQAMGADFAYIGSAFIATEEARATDAYKQAIVDGGSDDIVYSNLFTGVHGNYLAPSIRAAGLDPENLPISDPSKMNFGGAGAAKAWKEIWGCGQGIGVINKVQGAAQYVEQLKREYAQARARLAV